MRIQSTENFTQKSIQDFSARRFSDETFRALVKTVEVLRLIDRISYVFTRSILKNAPKELVEKIRKILGGIGSVDVVVLVSAAEPDILEESDRNPISRGLFFEYATNMRMQISGLVYKYLAIAPIEDIRTLLSTSSLQVIISSRQSLDSSFEVRFPPFEFLERIT